ncbi:MAG: hypothetical protein M1818_006020 [Claussenomyces sp. TS43310]|nr:MAG: hypothetical protein M1818_006020 [Claussenomyces sp. TS43310]
MSIAPQQPASGPDNYPQPQLASSDELANARVFAQRSTTPPALDRFRRAPEIPPAVPSPPSRHSPRSSSGVGSRGNSKQKGMAEGDMLASSQWLFSKEEVSNTPSISDGITVTEERIRRAKGVNFIIQAGILLRLPQLTLGTASVFFHRFYMRYSMVTENSKAGIHHYVRSSIPRSRTSQSLSKSLILSPEQNIAATALFLASKAEETCRKTKEIVIAVARVAQKNSNLVIDEQSKEFWRWKDSILAYEETMLELLTFDVVLDSPYTHLYDYLKQLDLDHNKPVRNVAWAFLNDSCMTVVCLRMRASDIAVAAIYFSAKFNEFQIPDDSDDEPWWARIEGVPERIIEAVNIMGEFYAENPLKKTDNPYEQGPDGSVHDLDKTRLRNKSHSPASMPREEQLVNGNGHVVMNGTISNEPNGPYGEDQMDFVGNMSDSQGETRIGRHAGDDDAGLKAAANDPATHQGTTENGTSNGTGLKHSMEEDAQGGGGSDTKKQKGSEREESEEGEVEE